MRAVAVRRVESLLSNILPLFDSVVHHSPHDCRLFTCGCFGFALVLCSCILHSQFCDFIVFSSFICAYSSFVFNQANQTKQFTMETVLQIKVIKENINRNDIVIKNLLKDIWECESDIQTLNKFNLDISKRINQTRQDLADFKRLIKTIEDSDMLSTLKSQLDSMQNQFEVNMVVLQKAVISSQRKINQKTRTQLFQYSTELRNRFNQADDSQPSEELVANQTANLTDSLQSVNRMLASEVERSGANLDSLVSSSALVTETSEEFKTMSNYISNSKTLLNKYGRRELTDKVLIALAMAFFYGCVIYVVMRRLYWK